MPLATSPFLNGAPGGIRTPDQLVRSQLLYPAELRALGLSFLLCAQQEVLRLIIFETALLGHTIV